MSLIIFLFSFLLSGCVSISAFDSLTSIPVSIMSSAVGLNICALTAGVKNYKSIIKKKERNTIYSVVTKTK